MAGFLPGHRFPRGARRPRGNADGDDQDQDQGSNAQGKKAPVFARSKGALYADWKIDLHVWRDGLPPSLTNKQVFSLVYNSLEENEKALIRHKGNKVDGQLNLTVEEAIAILDKDCGRGQMAQTWQAYQHWRSCKWRDKTLTIEDYNNIYDIVERTLHERVLLNEDGTAGHPDNLHTTFRGFHYLESLDLKEHDGKNDLEYSGHPLNPRGRRPRS